jgi:hypothetical protein
LNDSITFLSLLPDLCTSLEVDEVEIFSLIEEQIPKYKIRTDKITRFAGTANQDFEFVQFPALNIPANVGLGLNGDQMRETLNYFRKYHFIFAGPSRVYEWVNHPESQDSPRLDFDSWSSASYSLASRDAFHNEEEKGQTREVATRRSYYSRLGVERTSIDLASFVLYKSRSWAQKNAQNLKIKKKWKIFSSTRTREARLILTGKEREETRKKNCCVPQYSLDYH